MASIEFIYMKGGKLECPQIYPHVLREEGPFSIRVNSRLWFYEPDFPVCEFLLFVKKWLDSPDVDADMEYHALDTEDNPLISFVKREEGWFLQSPWQLFENDVAMTRTQIEVAIHSLRKKQADFVGRSPGEDRGD